MNGGYCDKSRHDDYDDLVASTERLTEEIAELNERLTQTRLDLMNSDAIRAEMVQAARQTAGHVVHALELLEAAFHAGFKFSDSPRAYEITLDQAFRDWFKENG